jgi:pre-mRNA cleavage complex 2 protein Pcf11
MSEPAEVADDFKADLKDLTSNDRYAISNFTVIAKESVQHADEISKVICDHIMEVCTVLS